MTIGSSASISKSNLFSQTHANVYNLINNRSNVPDPNDSSGDRHFVYTREPKTLGRGFAGYPLIIVSSIKLSQGTGVISNTKHKTTYDIDIRIISSDRVSDTDGNPIGQQTLDTISDDVIETLNDDDTLFYYGMKSMEIEGAYEWTDFDGKPIYIREISLSFNQLQTTA